MPVVFNLEPAIFKWQVRHNEKMTYTELAKRAGITLATLNRIKNGTNTSLDLKKINAICKVLECEPADLLIREETVDIEVEGDTLEDRIQQSMDLEQSKQLLKDLDELPD